MKLRILLATLLPILAVGSITMAITNDQKPPEDKVEHHVVEEKPVVVDEIQQPEQQPSEPQQTAEGGVVEQPAEVAQCDESAQSAISQTQTTVDHMETNIAELRREYNELVQSRGQEPNEQAFQKLVSYKYPNYQSLKNYISEQKTLHNC